MGLLANFNISGSAISAQSLRLNTVASNLANVETIAGSASEAYRSRQPVFQAMLGNLQRPGEVGVQMRQLAVPFAAFAALALVLSL